MEVIRIKNISGIVFLIGWTLLIFSFYFNSTRGLHWISSLFFIGLSLLLFRYRYVDFNRTGSEIYPLIAWFFLLLPYCLISPFPIASLEAFYLNYVTNFILFFILFSTVYYQWIREERFWLIFSFISTSIIFYYLFIVSFKCSYNITCFLSSSFNFIQDAHLRGLVVIVPPLVLIFFVTLGFSFSTSKLMRFMNILISILTLFFLIYIGRRAAIIGIIFSILLLPIIIPKRKVIIFSFGFVIFLTICLSVFLLTPYGKTILYKSRDNLNYLLSTNPEDWAKAGSMGQRLYIWPIYLKKSLEEPFAGTGLGRRVQKRVLSETNKKALTLEHAHNLFLNIALQAGWHNALFFLFFYFITLRKGYNLIRISNGNPYYVSLFLFLIAFFILSMFEGMEEGTRFSPFWIAGGLIWGYEKRLRQQSSLSS